MIHHKEDQLKKMIAAAKMIKWKFNMKHHKQLRKVKRNKIQKKAKYKIMNNNFYNLLQKI